MASEWLTLWAVVTVVLVMVLWMRAQQNRIVRSFRLRSNAYRNQQQDLSDLGYQDSSCRDAPNQSWPDMPGEVEEDYHSDLTAPEPEIEPVSETAFSGEVIFVVDPDQGWCMGDCVAVLLELGLRLSEDGILRRIDSAGQSRFCVASACEPGRLEPDSDQMVPGVVFLCQASHEVAVALADMLRTAQALQQHMGGTLLDGDKIPLDL